MSRLLDLFLEPAAPRPAPSPQAVAPAAFTAVLAPATDLAATAGGVAAAVRRAAHARAALVLTMETVAPRSAFPGAAALARRLAARELQAAAAGRLCHVALPRDHVEASALVSRLRGTVDVPLVVALPSRVDGFDRLLARADQLVLSLAAGTPEDLADLALASLAALGPPAVRIAPPVGVLTARAAALGLVAIDLAPAGPARVPGFEPPRHTDVVRA